MILLVLAVVATFLAVGLATYLIAAALARQTARRASLRLLAAYGDQDLEGQRRLDPFSSRAFDPVVIWASDLAHRISPAGYVEATRRKLAAAGYAQPQTTDRFLATRVVAVAAVLPVSALVVAVLSLGGPLRVAVFVLLVLLAVLGPDAILSRRAEARQDAIRAALPQFIDLLTISVEAGLGFDQALARIATEMRGPLAEELRRMFGETRAGASRSAALRSLADRAAIRELRSFVLAVLQADAFGATISEVLRGQSEEMRIKWQQLAQERAQKAPVKMLVPTVLCVFPALFVVTIGPALVRIAKSGV